MNIVYHQIGGLIEMEFMRGGGAKRKIKLSTTSCMCMIPCTLSYNTNQQILLANDKVQLLTTRRAE